MRRQAGLSQKRKALLQWQGYADGLTMSWIVKSPVAMNMSKTRRINPKSTEKVIRSDRQTLTTKDEKSTVEWKHINWRKLEKGVYKLQKRIYRASSRGDVKAVRRLQKTLMKSWSGKMLAVRRVTQDNQGKVRHEVVQRRIIAL